MGSVTLCKTRYRLTCRGIRDGKYYCVDTQTGKRSGLRTSNADEARQIVEAKNQSERQPALNLHIPNAFLTGTDNGITTRTWRHAIGSPKEGETHLMFAARPGPENPNFLKT